MSTAPSDDDNGGFRVLVNGEEQYSLWPASAPVPLGWTVAFGGADGGAPREACLEYVDRHWTDLRPRSLRDSMDREFPAATGG